MKHLNFFQGKIRIIILILLIGAVSLDFMVSDNGVEKGTFRLESDFEPYTGGNANVAIIPSDYAGLSSPVSRSANPDYAQVEEMVSKAIELQGGFQGVIKKGDQVMIKINLVGGNSPSGQGENTDARVVKALIKLIDGFTGGDVEILVAEGSSRPNDDPSSNTSVWANSGYTSLLTDPYLAGINFRLFNLNYPMEDLVEIDLGKKGTSAIHDNKFHVHKAELEADVFISVPVLKIHNTGITNALKLQIGTAPGCYYGYNKMVGTSYSKGIFHKVGHRLWTTEAIVDLSAIADIDYVVVDALMCLETYKSYKETNQVRMNTIIAGVDPVAVDHVCTKLLGLNPDDIAHITLAEKAGLGTNDFDKISISGASIDEVKKNFKKNPSENGKFGQSNRTWILSQPFKGTDFSKEYIPNEARLLAEPGKNGWSQPVYFFDDRIDLLSYYQGEKNMVSYAYTNFSAQKNQQAELWLGTQEAISVYVNGELAYSSTSNNDYGDDDLGQKVQIIPIKEGKNTLLVKSLNKYGDYSFALNICEVEDKPDYAGNRVEGLKFYQGNSLSIN